MRSALGAGRTRVIWQMLIEAIVLTGIGTVAGIALAWVGIRQLLALAPDNIPRADTVAIDVIVLMFTVVTALAAACVFALVPAVSAFRLDLVPALSGAGRSAGLGGRGRLFRSAIVVLEVALCFVLLIGSGLMFRSFLELRRVDPDSIRMACWPSNCSVASSAPSSKPSSVTVCWRSGCARSPVWSPSPRRIRFLSRATSAPFAGDSKMRSATTRNIRRWIGRSCVRGISIRCARRSSPDERSPSPTTIRSAISWSSTPCSRQRHLRTNRQWESASSSASAPRNPNGLRLSASWVINV